MTKWREADIPDQSGKHIVVTGANTGLGFETARALAEHGADVVLACRSQQRGRAAAARIGKNARYAQLDLGDPDSIHSFAKHVKQVDVLVNNAGIMIPPFGRTRDGWEQQFGVNYIGHHDLTARLWPKLRKSKGRVVTLSSIAHRRGRIDFDNLRGEKKYNPWREYQQSKLADLLFAKQLARRQDEVLSVAAHPGVSDTELVRSHPFLGSLGKPLMQSAARGALPQLYAATMPVEAGSYWGPNGLREMKGWPAPAKVSKSGRDDATAARLWDVGEDATQGFGF